MSATAAASAAFAGVSATNAAAAEEAAHEARVERCKVSMPQFHDITATVESRQAYASCVREVYPQPLPSNQVIILKILVTLLLIGAAIGGLKGASDDGLGEALWQALAGFLIVAVAEIAIGAIVWAFVFLVTG